MTTQLDTIEYAAFGQPCFGERFSGDTAIIEQRDGLLFIAIVDVLGHGNNAHALASKIETFLLENWSSDLITTIQQLHEELKGTLGAAVGLTVINPETGELSYLSIGNTVLRIFGRRSSRLYSIDGIIGGNLRHAVEQKLQLTTSDVVILYTDGIKDRFELHDYPQIIYESPSFIARNIVKRFHKKYDDATCIALRYKR